jgi:hypothetical protein
MEPTFLLLPQKEIKDRKWSGLPPISSAET